MFEKAVALFEPLAKNHVFHNGNKRTAFAYMTNLLFINDHVCVMNERRAADLTWIL
ncbi:Fic family protein [Neobacillus sp. 3P2-tot-E-2]|uniref:Fic family protein n=1 Tax=Neobacillus sp. 3P2-tot-E-2 TaxID=3132212 RepID=UPI0039A3F641